MQQIQQKSGTPKLSQPKSAQQQQQYSTTKKSFNTSVSKAQEKFAKKDVKFQNVEVKGKKAEPKQFWLKQHVTVIDTPKDSLQSIEPRVMVAIEEIPVKTRISMPAKHMIRQQTDWVLAIIIIVLIILASIRIIFSTYLRQLFLATVSFTAANKLYRERTFSIFHAAFRLDLLFYFVAALFVYETFSIFGGMPSGWNQILIYLACMAGVVGYYLVKRLLFLLAASFNESKTETIEFLFNVNIYNRILGLILFPLTLIIAFIPTQNVKLFFSVGIALIVIFYLLSLVRGSKILLKKHFSISYLILYLCTLEFLPMVIVLKIIIG